MIDQHCLTDRADQFEPLLAAIARQLRIGFDSEVNSMHHYHEKLIEQTRVKTRPVLYTFLYEM